MAINNGLVEWIVKTALLDDAVPSEELVALMKENGLTSTHLLNYIDEDAFWPIHVPDESFKISSQDEKYILDFKNPVRKQEVTFTRNKAKAAVHSRFYSGHRFNEWDI